MTVICNTKHNPSNTLTNDAALVTRIKSRLNSLITNATKNAIRIYVPDNINQQLARRAHKQNLNKFLQNLNKLLKTRQTDEQRI